MFITVSTTDPYRDSYKSTPHPLSVYLYPILILYFHRCLGLPSHQFRPISTSQLCVRFSRLSHTCQCHTCVTLRHLSYKNITTLNNCRTSEEIKCDTLTYVRREIALMIRIFRDRHVNTSFKTMDIQEIIIGKSPSWVIPGSLASQEFPIFISVFTTACHIPCP